VLVAGLRSLSFVTCNEFSFCRFSMLDTAKNFQQKRAWQKPKQNPPKAVAKAWAKVAKPANASELPVSSKPDYFLLLQQQAACRDL
jgi:hypothetical protein